MSITSRFFTVTVKPQIPASKQHAGNIADTQVLFDWTGFDIPKGAAKLTGMTVLYRGKDEADVTPVDFELFFAKSNAQTPKTAPATLGPIAGTVQAVAAGTQPWFNDLIGKIYIDASLMTNDGDMIHMNVLNLQEGETDFADTGRWINPYSGNLVMEGQPESGTNVGYDKVYVAAVSKGNHNWETTLNLNGASSASSPTLTVQTKEAQKCFAPGDVLADQDDLALGTVKTIDSATKITLESNCANVSADTKIVYNENPIVLKLHFER